MKSLFTPVDPIQPEKLDFKRREKGNNETLSHFSKLKMSQYGANDIALKWCFGQDLI